MAKTHLKKMFIPQISIITVVLILIVILFISTEKNLYQQKMMAEQELREKGDIIMGVLNASLGGESPAETIFEVKLAELIERISDDPDFLHLFLVNRSGDVFPRSQLDERGIPSSNGELVGEAWQSGDAIREDRDGRLLEMARATSGYVIVVGLSLERLLEARRKDISHAIFMGFILLLLGTASIYFVFVTQNYYAVERALDTMRSYMGHVVDSMPGALISVNPEGNIVTVNKAAIKFLELEGTPVKNMKIGDVVKPEDSRVYEMLESHGRAFEVEGEATLVTRNEKIPIAASASVVLDNNGKNLGSVFILRDLRELRYCQNELLRSEKLALAGRLSMAIAHEIRNPLSSLGGFVHYFKKHFPSPSREKEYLDLMIYELDRVNGTITDLLNLSKPKAPVFTRGTLSDAILKSVNVMRGKADEGFIQIETNVHNDVPEVAFDEEQVHQALLNVLINAVEATPPGGTIRVTAEWEKFRGVARLEVEDSGPGIDDDIASQIFDPFASGKDGGTGLGLTVVKQVLDLHGWGIDVRSERGKGTTFTIEIPVTEEEIAGGEVRN